MEGETKIICVIGDEDTVTGFLLAGVGQRDSNGANFLVVDASE
jgi:V-type H+-transporting ATPase subunit F